MKTMLYTEKTMRVCRNTTLVLTNTTILPKEFIQKSIFFGKKLLKSPEHRA